MRDSNRLYRRDTDILYTPRSCLLHKPPVGDTEISCVNHEQESLTAIEYHDIHIMDLSGSAYYFDTLKELTKIKYMIFKMEIIHFSCPLSMSSLRGQS